MVINDAERQPSCTASHSNDDENENTHKRKPYHLLHRSNQRKAREKLLETAEYLSGGDTAELLVDTILHNLKAKAEAIVTMRQDFVDDLKRMYQYKNLREHLNKELENKIDTIVSSKKEFLADLLDLTILMIDVLTKSKLIEPHEKLFGKLSGDGYFSDRRNWGTIGTITFLPFNFQPSFPYQNTESTLVFYEGAIKEQDICDNSVAYPLITQMKNIITNLTIKKHEITWITCDDLKMIAYLMQHYSFLGTYPCPFCDKHKDCFLDILEKDYTENYWEDIPMRDIIKVKSTFQHHLNNTITPLEDKIIADSWGYGLYAEPLLPL